MSVLIQTTLGDITIDLFTDECPLTCENFLKLNKIKYYHGCKFHTVIENIIAVTGDPSETRSGGQSIFTFLKGDDSRFFYEESPAELNHPKKGTVAMLRHDNDRIASQFYITLGKDVYHSKPIVFGEVAEGFDTLDRINEASVDNFLKPLQNIRILYTYILDDPFPDPPGLLDLIPDVSPEPPKDESQTREFAYKKACFLPLGLESVRVPYAELPPDNLLCVNNLSPHTLEEELHRIFSCFGTVRSFEIPRHKATGGSLCYALIEFEDKKACKQACLKMNNCLVDGRRITVEFCQTVASSKIQHLKAIASLIETGVYDHEVQRISRALRLTMAERKNLEANSLSLFINYVLLPGSDVHSRLSTFLPKVDEQDMEVNTATSRTQAPVKNPLLELEIYCYLLLLIFLIDQKKYNEAKACSSAACSSASIAHLKTVNRRTADVLASRLYFYYSLCYELTGDLAEIRGNLLALYRTAVLRHDELGQETLLNLLLRNYLHYNLYDQAEKLRSKAPRFEAHSKQQFCRYLFYLGKIRTIQLDYTVAKESLLQAACKAPQAALGFRVQCNKWAIIVQLLLGEIPERTIFMQKGMEKALRPYFELTNAVRIGDLELFRNVAEKFSSTFSSDRTNNLIVRVRYNVIRTGLRNISLSYSRISLADVAKKLRLDSPNPVADAESIVSKAIRDGVIEASLDHTNGWMVSKETGDIYSTNAPQIAFNSRIAFCLNMHNEAVRALRFPPNSHEKGSAGKWKLSQQQEQELAEHKAAEDDD